MANIRPADMEAQAETIVISWVEGEAQPPRNLAEVVSRYRDLVIYADAPTTSTKESLVASLEMDKLNEKLLEAAAVKIRISSQAEAQLRRIRRKEEDQQRLAVSKMSYTERCNYAIAKWRAGEQVVC